MISELGSASNRIGEVIGLGREAIVIIVKRRVVSVNHSPGVLFPMGREDNDGFRLRI